MPKFRFVVDQPPPGVPAQVVYCCRHCDGDGEVAGTVYPVKTCPECGGTGLDGFALPPAL